MIIGIGVDVVDLARFERALSRTPALTARLFADAELVSGDRLLPLRSLAGRFAAKEALIKALGESTGIRWHHMQVVSDGHGNPSFVLSDAAARVAGERGVTALHLSMSHDAGVAVAYVVAEGSP
ncbi:MAG: holo-ACP synthase [Microbacteriaceae bacterium]|nr:holo-ACP synthase [Microbacteriaceae bacterium]